MTTKFPRGYRNHNPMNVKELPGDKTVWLGERATDDDPEFEEMEYVEAGIRMGVKIIQTYYNKHKIVTIREFVKRFAPGADRNNEAAYRKVLCDALGADDTTPQDFSRYDVLFPFVKAIIKHELGPAPKGWEGRNDRTWYADAVIRRGIELAGINHTVPPATQSPTARAATATAVGGVALGVDQLITIADKASGYANLPVESLIRFGVIVAVVALALYIVNRRRKVSKEAPQ